MRLPSTEIRRLIEERLMRHAGRKPMDHAIGSITPEHLTQDPPQTNEVVGFDPTQPNRLAFVAKAAGDGGAPADAKYVVIELHGDLTEEVLHSALSGTQLHDPKAHAPSHKHGGGDEVATATPGANAIPKAGVGGKLAAGWVQEILAYADLTDDPVGDHEAAADPQAASEALVAEALRIHQENTDADRRLGQHGAQFIPAGSGVLTHCNTGSLATGGYGTALGVIRAAWEQGKLSRVYASETRPLLQGARLTAWELTRDGIPATLIVEGAVGLLMRRPQAIACVIVGADRIAANGDVANKIGTYNLAVLAKEHAIPFYVAAPTSTIDLGSASGDQIPIEERPPEEVTTFAGAAVAPAGIEALNPAFDVTPHRYVSAIITERGIAREPYAEALSQLFQQEGVRHA